jgi:hypothetical protein
LLIKTSFRRRPESSLFNKTWTPAFAGVTWELWHNLLGKSNGFAMADKFHLQNILPSHIIGATKLVER